MSIPLFTTARPTVPNVITGARLILLPLIWYMAYAGMAKYTGYAIAVSLFSDIADGAAARYLNQETSFGAKFDSFADNMLLVSAPVWIYWIDKRVIIENLPFFVAYLAGLICVFALMFIKYRRNVEIHTYLSKIGTSVTWIFIIYTFVIGFSQPLFILAMLLSYAFLVEDLILLAIKDDLDEKCKGLLFERELLASLFRRGHLR
jgi:phosphatidylglycerophosphate synthase